MASGAAGAVARQIGRIFTTGVVAGLDEGQLLDRFVSRRDEAAFEALVARHGPMVLGVCRRLLRDPNDVDDAFQATFLVLVRKAGSLRRRDLLGNWLYGVAYRVAVRSRALAARRHAAETPSTWAEALAPAREEPGEARDLRSDLHDEVHNLPDAYRAPVVLCYLEGLTHEQAAEHLGWPVGTVKGRLSRARDLLRTRLTRRGLTLASGAAAVDLLARESPAAVPEALVSLTVKAAAHAAAGKTLAAGAVSASAAALTEGVLHAMTISKWKTLLVSAAVAAGVTTGAGVSAYQGFGPGSAPGDSEPKKAQLNDPDAARKTYGPNPADAMKKVARTTEGKRAAAPDTYSLHETYSTAMRSAINTPDQIFGEILAERKEWSPHLVDRLFHWSRAVKESEEYLSNEPKNIAAARKAHWSRMKRLYERTQSLKTPDQPAIADAGRTAFQAADGDMADALPGSRTSPVPAGASVRGGKAAGVGGRPPGGMLGRGGGGGGFGVGYGGGFGGQSGGGGGIGGVVHFDPESGGGFGGGGDDSRAVDARTRLNIAEFAPQVAANDRSPVAKRIRARLDEPISMNFQNPTPFEDLLKYIRSATQGPNDSGLPIYVDPAGLKDADATMQSTVILDLESVPLKTTLRLALKQIGMAYCVKDGVIIISSPDGVETELQEAMRADLGRENIDEAPDVEKLPAAKPNAPARAPAERPQAK